jgi:predicted GIY-YIG superfamily endonuclease
MSKKDQFVTPQLIVRGGSIKRTDVRDAMTKRDAYTYALYDGKEKVYIGYSSDVARRVEQHRQAGLKFTRAEVTSGAMTSGGAKREEVEQMRKYLRNHSGEAPRYNHR